MVNSPARVHHLIRFQRGDMETLVRLLHQALTWATTRAHLLLCISRALLQVMDRSTVANQWQPLLLLFLLGSRPGLSI